MCQNTLTVSIFRAILSQAVAFLPTLYCMLGYLNERLKPSMDTSIHADYVLDLGEKACGQLVMEVMLAMRDLAAGQTLLVTAYDRAAREDLAAWCRMTGNTFMQTLPDLPGNQFLLRKGR
jgi:cysteine desulfurase